jgi:hypothetical protein
MLNKLLKRARIVFSMMVPITILAFICGYFTIYTINVVGLLATFNNPSLYDLVRFMI